MSSSDRAVETLFSGLHNDCELNYLGALVGLLWTYIADSVKVCQGLNYIRVGLKECKTVNSTMSVSKLISKVCDTLLNNDIATSYISTVGGLRY